MDKDHLVFIGGWTRDRSSYRKFLEAAPESVEVTFLPCYDIIHKCGTVGLAEELRIFLEEHKLKQVFLAAHSLGGIIAMDYALTYPEQVRKLILIDSAGLPPPFSIWSKITKMLRAQIQFWRFKYKENLLTLFRTMQRPRKNLRSLLIAYSFDISDRIGSITCSTLLMWGEADHIYPLSQAKRMNSLIKNSSIHVVKNGDHDWIIHSPKSFWKNYK